MGREFSKKIRQMCYKKDLTQQVWIHISLIMEYIIFIFSMVGDGIL